MEEVPRCTSLAPFASPCLVLYFIGVEAEGLLDFQGGRGWDHFHFTVESSPCHEFSVSSTVNYSEFLRDTL